MDIIKLGDTGREKKNSKLQVPYFAEGTLESLEYNLYNENGLFYNLDKVLYVYLKDSGKLAYINPKNKTIKYVVGDYISPIQLVDELPEVGEVNVIYIQNNNTYIWNGIEYIPTYQPAIDIINPQISELKQEIEDVKGYTDSALELHEV